MNLKATFERFSERGPEGKVFPGVSEEPRICGLCDRWFLAPRTHQSKGKCMRAARAFRSRLKQNPPPWFVAAQGKGGGALAGVPVAAAVDVPPQSAGSDEDGGEEPSDDADDEEEDDCEDEDDEVEDYEDIKDEDYEDSTSDDGLLEKKRPARTLRMKSTSTAAGELSAKEKKRLLAKAALETFPGREGPRKNTPAGKADENLPDKRFPEEMKPGSECLQTKTETVLGTANREEGEIVDSNPDDPSASQNGNGDSEDLAKKLLSGLCVYIQNQTPKQERASSLQGVAAALRDGGSGVSGDRYAGPFGDDFRRAPRADDGSSYPGNPGADGIGRRLELQVADRWDYDWPRPGNPGAAESRHLDRRGSISSSYQNPSLPSGFYHPRSEDEYGRSAPWSPDRRYRYPNFYGHSRPDPFYNDRPKFSNGHAAHAGYKGAPESRRQLLSPFAYQPSGPRYESRRQQPEEDWAHQGSSVVPAASAGDGGPFLHGASSHSDFAASYSRPALDGSPSLLERSSVRQDVAHGEGTGVFGHCQVDSERTGASGAGASGVAAERTGRGSHTSSNGRGDSFENQGRSKFGPNGSVAAKSPNSSTKEKNGEELDGVKAASQVAIKIKPAGTVASHARLHGKSGSLEIAIASSKVEKNKSKSTSQSFPIVENVNTATPQGFQKDAEKADAKRAVSFEPELGDEPRGVLRRVEIEKFAIPRKRKAHTTENQDPEGRGLTPAKKQAATDGEVKSSV